MSSGDFKSYAPVVGRMKSKRWVQASNPSYDGGDWGDEYNDDYYDEYEQGDEEVPPMPEIPQNLMNEAGAGSGSGSGSGPVSTATKGESNAPSEPRLELGTRGEATSKQLQHSLQEVDAGLSESDPDDSYGEDTGGTVGPTSGASAAGQPRKYSLHDVKKTSDDEAEVPDVPEVPEVPEGSDVSKTSESLFPAEHGVTATVAPLSHARGQDHVTSSDPGATAPATEEEGSEQEEDEDYWPSQEAETRPSAEHAHNAHDEYRNEVDDIYDFYADSDEETPNTAGGATSGAAATSASAFSPEPVVDHLQLSAAAHPGPTPTVQTIPDVEARSLHDEGPAEAHNYHTEGEPLHPIISDSTASLSTGRRSPVSSAYDTHNSQRLSIESHRHVPSVAIPEDEPAPVEELSPVPQSHDSDERAMPVAGTVAAVGVAAAGVVAAANETTDASATRQVSSTSQRSTSGNDHRGRWKPIDEPEEDTAADLTVTSIGPSESSAVKVTAPDSAPVGEEPGNNQDQLTQEILGTLKDRHLGPPKGGVRKELSRDSVNDQVDPEILELYRNTTGFLAGSPTRPDFSEKVEPLTPVKSRSPERGGGHSRQESGVPSIDERLSTLEVDEDEPEQGHLDPATSRTVSGSHELPEPVGDSNWQDEDELDDAKDVHGGHLDVPQSTARSSGSDAFEELSPAVSKDDGVSLVSMVSGEEKDEAAAAPVRSLSPTLAEAGSGGNQGSVASTSSGQKYNSLLGDDNSTTMTPVPAAPTAVPRQPSVSTVASTPRTVSVAAGAIGGAAALVGAGAVSGAGVLNKAPKFDFAAILSKSNSNDRRLLFDDARTKECTYDSGLHSWLQAASATHFGNDLYTSGQPPPPTESEAKLALPSRTLSSTVIRPAKHLANAHVIGKVGETSTKTAKVAKGMFARGKRLIKSQPS